MSSQSEETTRVLALETKRLILAAYGGEIPERIRPAIRNLDKIINPARKAIDGQG